MSRGAMNEPVVVRPQNNIYTVLAAVGLVTVLLGILAVYLRAAEIFPGGLLGK